MSFFSAYFLIPSDHQSTCPPSVRGRMADHWTYRATLLVPRYRTRWRIHTYRRSWVIESILTYHYSANLGWTRSSALLIFTMKITKRYGYSESLVVCIWRMKTRTLATRHVATGSSKVSMKTHDGDPEKRRSKWGFSGSVRRKDENKQPLGSTLFVSQSHSFSILYFYIYFILSSSK